MTGLMSWRDADELKPYPWATIPCPTCEETELAQHFGVGAADTDFVCMNCGCVTKIEER